MITRADLSVWILTAFALTLLCSGCQSSPRKSDLPPPGSNAPLLPDPNLTPGAVLPVTRDDLCVPGYTKKVRNVPLDVKRQVYAEYGITQHRPGDYEVDHLISLELGGSNSLKNLWPQAYFTKPWNAHVKDALENELHEEVCSGKLELSTAQQDIATNWIAAYKKYFHTDKPLSGAASHRRYGKRHDSGAVPAPMIGRGRVWVNLKSGKYFRPGARYYGNTKQGEYLSEADAIAQGYIAAKGK